jgi:RNA polymerase sigma-70 factor (ECF subfamily)
MHADDDTLLVARTLCGDRAAFAAVVEKYNRVLFAVALRMLGNYDEACDATQAVFVKAFEKLDSFDPQRKFFSWIYRILVNECLNARRARRPLAPLGNRADQRPGPLESFEAKERAERVRYALRRLSHDARQVVVLRHFGDLSYAEIGEILGIEEKTVKSRLFAARQRLLDLLAPGEGSHEHAAATGPRARRSA